MDANDLFAGVRIPPDLVIEFFVVFARFEFALKDAGYVRNAGSYAAPDWTRFSREAAVLFEEPNAFEVKSFKTLTEAPPMRQVLMGQTLTWAPLTLQGPPIARALKAAQQVRNNLFHGGKHSAHSEDGRDTALVAAALAILNACLARHDALRSAFEQPQAN